MGMWDEYGLYADSSMFLLLSFQYDMATLSKTQVSAMSEGIACTSKVCKTLNSRAFTVSLKFGYKGIRFA